VFDAGLVKMKGDVEQASKTWGKALKLLNGECPKEGGSGAGILRQRENEKIKTFKFFKQLFS